jgi:hypothetical protein
VNLKDSASLGLNDTSACRENPLFIKIGLRRRDVTIVEGDALFPLGENAGKLGITLRISRLDLHHFYFISAPEFPLSGPPVGCSPSPFLESIEQGEKIPSLPLCIKSRPERFFESMEQAILTLDPKDHRRLQGIEIEKPSLNFHKITVGG